MSRMPRMAGAPSVISGLLIAVTTIIGLVASDPADADTFDEPLVVLNGVVALGGFVLLLLVVVGVYASHPETPNAFGFVSFVAALVGTALLAGDHWMEAFAAPHLADVAPEVVTDPRGLVVVGAVGTFAVFAMGWLCFAVASHRAGLIARPAAAAIVLGAVLGAPPGSPGKVLFGLGLVAMGMSFIHHVPAGEGSVSAHQPADGDVR